MARINDVPIVLRQVGLWTFVKRVWGQVGEDAVFTWAAALAYSWMFAIFPFLVFLLSLVPLLPDHYKQEFKQDAIDAVHGVIVGDARNAFDRQIEGILDRDSAGGFLSFGLILTIWAASGGMNMTMAALDKAYDVEVGRPYWKQRSIAVLLTIVVATLIIVVMILMPLGSAVLKWLGQNDTLSFWPVVLLNVVRYILALLLLFTLLAIIYYFGTSFKQKFQSVTPGAVFCVMVWLSLGALFKLYLTRFGGADNYNKTYGAVAGAAILLLLFYIDATVLLIGAEINSEIDLAMGQGPDKKETVPAQPAKPVYP